jgi:hypothetical protein
MWSLSGIGEVPTPNMRSDVWNHVESYRILMLLACRLKIIPTSNLKLIISFLVLHIVLLSLQKLLSLVASTRHAHFTLRVYLRLANRPSAQFANSTYKNDLQAMGTSTAFLSSQGIILVAWVSIVVYLEQEPLLFFFPMICSTRETKKNYYQQATYKDQVPMVPQQSATILFQETSCLNGLHTMSLEKSAPEGLKPQECKRTKLCEPPPVPYVPDKDEVQEEAAKLRNLQIKTSLEKDKTLNFLVWHENGTREAFLVHVTAVLDTIKKRGTFKDHDKAQKAYEEAKKAVELAEAGLALLDGTSAGSRKNCKKKALVKA